MTETLDLDAVVIGGGVIGLAVARALATAGREVTLFEGEARLGNHTSSRSSEVIHAGIYYPKGSLKARLCVAGKELLYRYCAKNSVPHRRVGKIIVATRDEEVQALDGLLRKAQDNGVMDLEWLDARQIAELEPSVRAVRGLLSPSSGIIDSHAFMAALRRDAEHHGAHVVLNSYVQDGAVLDSGGFELRVGGDEPFAARCRTLVNAAGLTAQNVAAGSVVCRQRASPDSTLRGATTSRSAGVRRFGASCIQYRCRAAWASM